MAGWQPGQLLFVGFDGHEAPGDVLALIGAGRVGGAVLFARNVAGPDQVRALRDPSFGETVRRAARAYVALG